MPNRKRRGIPMRRRAAQRRPTRARTADRAGPFKDELLASLAHDLRTRLHAMLGWLQLLRNGALDAEQSEHAIEVVHRNADAQVRLLDQALDASRIVSGRLRIVREPVSPAAVLESALEAVAPEARRRHVALEKDIPEHLPALDGNPRRLRQIVASVLENAVKFTPGGGHVRVRASAAGRLLRIEVRDDGAGIGKEALRHVLDGLRPSGGGHAPEHGGLGLGLAITRHLVRAHRGSIRVASPGPGRGTVVTLILPASRHAIGRDRAARSAEAGLPILKDVTALVVDDHEDSSELLAEYLERRGALVLRAADAGAAFETLAARRPDLLIADIAMPGMDGQELIRRVRGGGSSIPAIALSAGVRPGDRARALSAGFDAYCTKPVDAQEILRVIASLNPSR
jgi:CheY-like chemotaxis protein/nitrogen-specific signal transduction histidine kinase